MQKISMKESTARTRERTRSSTRSSRTGHGQFDEQVTQESGLLFFFDEVASEVVEELTRIAVSELQLMAGGIWNKVKSLNSAMVRWSFDVIGKVSRDSNGFTTSTIPVTGSSMEVPFFIVSPFFLLSACCKRSCLCIFSWCDCKIACVTCN